MPIPSYIERRAFGHAYGRKGAGPTPQSRPKFHAAGQTSSIVAFVGTDAAGNTASYDASGQMIPNTAMTNDQVRLPDSAMGTVQTLTPVSPQAATGSGTPGTTSNLSIQQTSQTQRITLPIIGAVTPTQLVGGILVAAAIGIAAYAMTRKPASSSKGKRARANPSRRRRRRFVASSSVIARRREDDEVRKLAAKMAGLKTVPDSWKSIPAYGRRGR